MEICVLQVVRLFTYRAYFLGNPQYHTLQYVAQGASILQSMLRIDDKKNPLFTCRQENCTLNSHLISTHLLRVLRIETKNLQVFFNSFFLTYFLGFIMALTPLHDRVLVRPAQPEEVTKGGIILPDTAKEKPMQGEVIAVGPGKIGDDGKTVVMQVATGDKVLYGKYSGTEINVDGEDMLIMRETDIFAVVK
jgi:chaperonin GroES